MFGKLIVASVVLSLNEHFLDVQAIDYFLTWCILNGFKCLLALGLHPKCLSIKYKISISHLIETFKIIMVT